MTDQCRLDCTCEPKPKPQPTTEPVTRLQLPTQPPKIFQCLLAGIDSLDLGMYVDWGEDWDRKFGEFEELKQRASDNGRKDPVLIEHPGITPFIVHANGKAPMYRFHLQVSDGHIWISKSQTPENNTPNVFVSFNSEPIWRDGLENVVVRLKTAIVALGAKVLTVQPSRADLCTDFYAPDGFNLYELVEQTVGPNLSQRHPTFPLNEAKSRKRPSPSAPFMLQRKQPLPLTHLPVCISPPPAYLAVSMRHLPMLIAPLTYGGLPPPNV